MQKGKLSLVCAIFIILAGCHDKDQSCGNKLFERLSKIKGQGILFGHQDDLAYGVDWKYVDGESDVKRVGGDYPVVFGWELGGLEQGNSCNLDSVPFNRMKSFAVKVHSMGGINTFSWHPYSVIDGQNSWSTDRKVVEHILPKGSHHQQFINQLNKVGAFLNSLTNAKGEAIPFIFRPWHEMDGSWFWWGQEHCTAVEYMELFRFTIDYLHHNFGLPQMLVAYSPDCNFSTEDEYLTWYPGDEYIDIIGMDNYYDLKSGQKDKAIEKLHVVIHAANSKQKLSALTETGLENVTDSLWYTQKLGYVLNDSLVKKNLSYVMVWRNDPDVHHFFPYPGHKAEKDAKKFLAQDGIWLLNDLIQATSKNK